MKKIGFLSFGHWTPSPHSQVRTASDALLQSIDLAVAAEELGADGNDLELAEWVLSHGASADPARASDSRMPPKTLYEQAVRNGQHEFAALLARHGAATSGTAALSEREGFMAACFRADRAAVEALVREHPEYLTDPAPLLKAAEQDRADVAALLLDVGMSADVEEPQNGTRALHLAAYNDAEAVIRLLIDRGAEIDARDRAYDNTPIGWAHFGRRARAVDLLAPHTRDLGVLTNAGKLERLAEVLAGTTRPPRTGNEDDSLLFYLPDDETRAVDVVRLLLDKGEDPSIRRPDGTTAAQVARARGLDGAAAMLEQPAT